MVAVSIKESRKPYAKRVCACFLVLTLGFSTFNLSRPAYLGEQMFKNDSILGILRVEQQSLSGNEAPSKRPCRVVISNSSPVHYEILESIALQLPLQYLHFKKDCDRENFLFDYFVVKSDVSSRSSAPNSRLVSWKSYFESFMQGKAITVEPDASFPREIYSNKSGKILRKIGILQVFNNKNEFNTTLLEDSYDAHVEASCYCRSRGKELDGGKTCIFHEACPVHSQNPRAVWVSPHHAHYFIPTALPPAPAITQVTKRTSSTVLCSIGDTRRKTWGLFHEFFVSTNSSLAAKERFSRMRVDIFGNGGLPSILEPYKDQIRISTPPEYLEFYQQIATECNVIMLLLTKTGQANYFHSLQKLTGTIPIVLTYRKPVVLHEELYELYKEHFSPPSDWLVATHTDDPASFVVAMSNIIDQLEKQ